MLDIRSYTSPQYCLSKWYSMEMDNVSLEIAERAEGTEEQDAVIAAISIVAAVPVIAAIPVFAAVLP